jgi:hypothetical protein
MSSALSLTRYNYITVDFYIGQGYVAQTGLNLIYIVIMTDDHTLWSSGHSSWRQIQRSGIDSRHYQILGEVVGLERGPLSLARSIEELLGGKSSGSGLENREYLSRWQRDTLYPQKLALTSQTSGSRSVHIVRSRTEATQFFN